ncbi:MAG: helix-hairpin-helix domain-containing protein [Acidimicrobiia bacterium]
MPGRNWIAVAVLVLAVLAARAWYGRSTPEPAPLFVDTVAETNDDRITVHISGKVMAPGLVVVRAGSRLADAVAAAGGTTRDADLERVNLAAPLQDGQQVVIPGIEEGGATAEPVTDAKIHINTATPSELEQLPGVGPVLAERIAAFRDENGPFDSVEDLLDVSGIGESKLEMLRDSVAIP